MRVRAEIFETGRTGGRRQGAPRICGGLIACLGALLVSACGGDMIPSSRHPHRKVATAPPRYGADSPQYRMCTAKLSGLGARYTPLPDTRYGGGCDALGVLKLEQVVVPVTGLGPMTCGIAENFTAWAQYAVAPAARLYFGSELVRIDTFGTYSCRDIAGSGRLSEHAHANAIDIAAFLLADGRRISVQNGWNGDDASRAFLRRVRDSACKRFRTVLSPDYNDAHHDHLHFDMGGKGTYCR